MIYNGCVEDNNCNVRKDPPRNVCSMAMNSIITIGSFNVMLDMNYWRIIQVAILSTTFWLQSLDLLSLLCMVHSNT